VRTWAGHAYSFSNQCESEFGQETGLAIYFRISNITDLIPFGGFIGSLN